MANSVDPDQTAPIGVCSGSTLFASILNSSEIDFELKKVLLPPREFCRHILS